MPAGEQKDWNKDRNREEREDEPPSASTKSLHR